jgi:hypothetical protein
LTTLNRERFESILEGREPYTAEEAMELHGFLQWKFSEWERFEDIYAVYSNYCEEKRQTPLAPDAFRESLRRHLQTPTHFDGIIFDGIVYGIGISEKGWAALGGGERE